MKENDAQFSAFVMAYPPSRRKGGYMAEQLFLHALTKVDYATLMTALQQHKRSEEWQTPRYIPSLITWLAQELWLTVLPEAEQPNRRTPFEQARHEGLKKW